MNKKILITGAHGQLGTELSKLLPDAVLTDVENLDITDLNAVQRFVKENNIETIVNCAAYTAVDKAEEEPALAEKINVLGPANLAKSGAEIIHISTDYVFNGQGDKPWQADEKTYEPLSYYGQTKLEGEFEVIKLQAKSGKAKTIVVTNTIGPESGNKSISPEIMNNRELCEIRKPEEVSYTIEKVKIDGEVKIPAKSFLIVKV